MIYYEDFLYGIEEMIEVILKNKEITKKHIDALEKAYDDIKEELYDKPWTRLHTYIQELVENGESDVLTYDEERVVQKAFEEMLGEKYYIFDPYYFGEDELFSTVMMYADKLIERIKKRKDRGAIKELKLLIQTFHF